MKAKSRTKKLIMAIAVLIVAVIALGVLVGCGGNAINGITVVSREEGSGTRDAFDTLVGLEDLSPYAVTQNSTGNVMTKVSGTRDAIGYISLGSLNDTVKALTIDGVAASAENILNSTYKMQRNFNIVTKKGVEMNALAKDFIKFLNSADAQIIVKEEKFVSCIADAPAYEKPAEAMSGTLKISGSTSITPLMDSFKKAYIAKHPDVRIEIEGGGSSVGIKNVTGASDTEASKTIGMASRDLKTSETAVDAMVIAIDGVAVIVHPENDKISNATLANLKDIFEGTIESFDDIK